MITVNQNISAAAVGARGFGGSITEAGSLKVEVDNIFGASSVDVAQAGAFTAADVQSVMIVATQNMTLKTNSSGSPADTIDLIAGVPLFWSKSAGYFPNPFTTNVTGFFVSCTAASRLQMLIVIK